MLTAEVFSEHGSLRDLDDILHLTAHVVEQPEEFARNALPSDVEMLKPGAVHALLDTVKGTFHGLHLRRGLKPLWVLLRAEEVLQRRFPGGVQTVRRDVRVVRHLPGVQKGLGYQRGQDGKNPSEDGGEVDDRRLRVPLEVKEAHFLLPRHVRGVRIQEGRHEEPVVGQAEHDHVLRGGTDQKEEAEADRVGPCNGRIEVRVLVDHIPLGTKTICELICRALDHATSGWVQLVKDENVHGGKKGAEKPLQRLLDGRPSVRKDAEEAELHHVRPQTLVGFWDNPTVDDFVILTYLQVRKG
mmetsp:Transcript_31245/g.58673  ORF Transcript_31245/g.58673 Transcript_31245/m.58673 type:complete len:299 (-) Transcript_31245:394-1290(-)